MPSSPAIDVQPREYFTTVVPGEVNAAGHGTRFNNYDEPDVLRFQQLFRSQLFKVNLEDRARTVNAIAYPGHVKIALDADATTNTDRGGDADAANYTTVPAPHQLPTSEYHWMGNDTILGELNQIGLTNISLGSAELTVQKDSVTTRNKYQFGLSIQLLQDLINLIPRLTSVVNTSHSTITVVNNTNLTFVVDNPILSVNYQPGQRLRIRSSASPSNYVEGTVVSFIAPNLVVAVDTIGGTGTFSLWIIAPGRDNLPATLSQAQANWTQADNTQPDYIKNKPTFATVAFTGNYSDLIGAPSLATVAETGSYNDLTDKPTIPGASSVVTGSFNNFYSDSGLVEITFGYILKTHGTRKTLTVSVDRTFAGLDNPTDNIDIDCSSILGSNTIDQSMTMSSAILTVDNTGGGPLGTPGNIVFPSMMSANYTDNKHLRILFGIGLTTGRGYYMAGQIEVALN